MPSYARRIALVLAISALAAGAAGCGSDDPSGSRAAAGADSPVPTAAYFLTDLTSGVNVTGNIKLFRCALPDGPCTELATMPDGYERGASLQYGAGRLFFRLQGVGTGLSNRVMSCSASEPGQCTVLLEGSTDPKDLAADTGPVYRGGRLIVGIYGQTAMPQGLYSCDAFSTRSLADCVRVPDAPRLESLAPGGPDQVVGIKPAASGKLLRDVLVCDVGDGACRSLGAVPESTRAVDELAYLPEFGRVYVGLVKQPSKRSTSRKGEIWSCRIAGSSECTQLNEFTGTFERLIYGFAAAGDRVVVAQGKALNLCSPDTPKSCSAIAPPGDEMPFRAVASLGANSVLVGTVRWVSFLDDDTERNRGSLFRWRVDGGGGREATLWDNQLGGVASIVTDATSGALLRTTVERFTPRGSGVTATGTVTTDPAPASGAGSCALPTPEVPVTCYSTFPAGTTVTLTAKPGRQSALNTWQGAASSCNEPGGPGTPPATTCTITVTEPVTSVTAGFRPE